MKKRFVLFLVGLITSYMSLQANSSECWIQDTDIRGTYNGECINAKAHGYGISIGKDTYTGEFRHGKKHGKGKYEWQSGEVFEGNYRGGKRSGFGKYTYSNGDVYEGYFENGIENGKGKYTWKIGDVYEGDWLNGQRTGKGKYIWTNGNVYIGDLVNNKRVGEGKYIWANGNIYTGSWENDKKHGQGKFIASPTYDISCKNSGACYCIKTFIGKYRNGYMHFGEATFSNRNDKYIGAFTSNGHLIDKTKPTQNPNRKKPASCKMTK